MENTHLKLSRRISRKSNLVLMIISCLIFFGNVGAQPGNWAWVNGFGSASGGEGRGESIAVDPSGSVYSTGYYVGIVDFNPGVGVFNLNDSGYGDIYISKLDNSGNFVWAKSIGANGADFGMTISLDVFGNLYIIGAFSDTVDFDPGTGIFNLISSGDRDVFILKLNSSGNFIWAKKMGGPGGDDGYSLTIDASGNIYSTGAFSLTSDFDPGPGTFNLSTPGYGVFVSKLDSAGNFIWAKSLCGTDYAFGQCITRDQSDHLYLTGFYSGTVDFNPDSLGQNNQTAIGSYDIFICKLDSSGEYNWAKTIGGINADGGWSITTDNFSNVYFTGVFSGTVDFNPGSNVVNLTATDGNSFISKFDSSGNFSWAKVLYGPIGGSGGSSIALNGAGNVYTVGQFDVTIDFDPGPLQYNLTSYQYTAMYISELDNFGNFVWAEAIGGTEGEAASSIAFDNSNNLYITGWFGSIYLYFGSQTLINASGNSNLWNMFVAKMDFVTRAEEVNKNESIFIFPNPASNFITLKLKDPSSIGLSLTDLTGKLIYSDFANNIDQFRINLMNYANGIYFLNIKTDEVVETKKIIIER